MFYFLTLSLGYLFYLAFHLGLVRNVLSYFEVFLTGLSFLDDPTNRSSQSMVFEVMQGLHRKNPSLP